MVDEEQRRTRKSSRLAQDRQAGINGGEEPDDLT